MTSTSSARLAILLLLAVVAVVPVGAAAQSRQRGSVMADYDPSMGVRVTSPDGSVQLTAPVGALDGPATFSQEALDPPGAAGGGVRLTRAFKLEAAGADRRPITRFARPLRLVVRYDETDLDALKVKPGALRLFYQDASAAWRMIPTEVDTSGRVLRAEVDHFTLFAMGTTGVNDTFDRPNSTTELGTATSGQVWRTDGTIWGICANAACAIGPPGAGHYTRINSGVLAQDVAVTIQPRATGAVGPAGILLNVTADWNTNLLYVDLDPAGEIEVWTLTGGNWSNGPIARQATAKTGDIAHTLEAYANNGSLIVLVDGTQLLGPLVVPTAPADATYVGMFVDTTETEAGWPRYADFQAIPGS